MLLIKMNPYPLFGNRFQIADTSRCVWIRHGKSLLFKEWLKENRLKKQKKEEKKAYNFSGENFYTCTQTAFWFYPPLHCPHPRPYSAIRHQLVITIRCNKTRNNG